MKRQVVGLLLMGLGLAIIGTVLGMRFYASSRQQKVIKAFQQTIEEADVKNVVDHSQKDPGAKPPKQIFGTVGIMIIPKINLDVAVEEGVEVDKLRYSVGHFAGTAMPGEKGNFCVAGHRSYTYSEYFNRLDELGVGDKIIMRTQKGEYTYVVTEKKVVEPTEVSVLNPTKESTITLVTCTPIRIATHRLIIKGRLVI